MNMKNHRRILIVIIVAVLMLTMACNIGPVSVGGSATDTPQPKATDVPPQATVPPEATKASVPTSASTTAPSVPKGAVVSLDDVKSATIQIQSEGTFIDPQVGMQVNAAGRGSGFIIDSSGIAVTNNHVVTGAALLKVWVGGNKDKVYSARVLGASECSDLAVIKIDGANFPFLQWHDGTPKVSLDVYAAGYPLGDPEFTLTKGIISKANADGNTNWASVGSVLEHDARINPGNSGGPLVDKDGKVVGINYAANDKNQYFAIARAEADLVLADLKAGNDVTSLGVNGEVVITQDQTLSGIWVSSVKSGSPADKSGLKPGDIIVQMEGLVLGTDGTKADYCQILRTHKPTDTLSLNVLRWGTKQILEGQINGRQLAVTGTYTGGGQANNGGNSGNTGNTGSKTTSITDDSSVITMEVPSDWEYDGSEWNDTWKIGGKSYDFMAQTLTASTSVKDYVNGWTTAGLFVATSSDWGKIGGYANLLEGVKQFYTDCTPTAAQSYKDSTYEGQMIVYTKCGSNKGGALVLAGRPIKNPTAYLFMVEMKFTSDAELKVLEDILNTLDITP
jgi:serine protease Do